MPKKTQITLTLDAILTPEQKREMQFLLSDALYEFEGPRRDAEEYVAKRYTNKDGKFVLGGAEAQARKVAQVQLRCQLARALHDAALRVSVDEVDDVDEGIFPDEAFLLTNGTHVTALRDTEDRLRGLQFRPALTLDSVGTSLSLLSIEAPRKGFCIYMRALNKVAPQGAEEQRILLELDEENRAHTEGRR